MSGHNGNKRADKQNNKPDGGSPASKGTGVVGQGRQSQGRAAELGPNKKSATRKHKTGYDFDDVDDEFEEFEPVKQVEMQTETDDNKLTIWMNSWIDDDDFDFAPAIKNNKINAGRSNS